MGGVPGDYEYFLGMPGMHGTYAANNAINESDLLIAIGVRFDDRVTGKLETFAPRAQVIHIDIDPAEIGKNVAAHIPIVGDVKLVLKELIKRLQSAEIQDTSAWRATVLGGKAPSPCVTGRSLEAA